MSERKSKYSENMVKSSTPKVPWGGTVSVDNVRRKLIKGK